MDSLRIIQKKCYLEWRRKAVVMKRTRTLGTDRLLRPRGRGVVLEGGGGTILKQAPFEGVNFSLVRNMRGVKFYGTATAV